ncbi:DUF3857 domain-containing protein [Sphingomicrobium marinum]|uniref:DUF3857 domain-containing protein n=1 Tax=Sphingomicrobium marinum TaxID=1227950 RepID=UPI00223ECE91|nr:DUF3857 domain-containing protein [Sphingomicrobium marinum]
MRISKFFRAASIAALAAPSLAQELAIERGPVPEWVEASDPLPVPAQSDGAFFVQRQDSLIHLTGKGQWTYSGQRIHITHPQALEAGNVAIVWNPAAGSPVVHSLLIHRDGTAIDVLENSDFEILRREDQLELAILDGLLTAVLRVPDLRVGDAIELEYTTPSHDPTFGQQSFGIMFLADAPPPGRFKLAVSWDEGQAPNVRFTDDFGVDVERSKNSLTVDTVNPDVLNPPSGAPPRFNWTRLIEYSDFKDWADVSRTLFPLYRETAKLAADSPLKAEAARIMAAHGTPMARAQAALKLVQQQVRYIYVGLNGGNLKPATADETWQRRYGDCKGKTVLLLALLDELDIQAEPVLASNAGADDGFDSRLANPGLFDHVLVRATIDGEQYWMDGTLPPVATASTDPALPYKFTLPLASKGAALEKLPWKPATLPDEMGIFDIDASEGFDKPARKTQTMLKRGIEGLNEYLQLSAVPAAQLENSIRNNFIGSGGWDTIESVSYHYDVETRASILQIVGTGPVDWDGEDGLRSLSLPGGGFSPPPRRQRPDGQPQEAPYYSSPSYNCYATTIRIPEESDITQWQPSSVFDTMLYGRIYYRMMERRDDGSIRMVRGSRTEETEFSPQRAAKDNARLERFDNSMARIHYRADRNLPLVPGMPEVPAADEVDWTGTNPPCLPADVKAGR